MSVRAATTVVVGTGLIGASLAWAGRSRGLLGRVVGVGRTRANLDAALRAGIVDEISQDVASAVRGASLVVLAAPADACETMLGVILANTDAGTVVTDVASVKVPLLRAARAAGGQGRYVGGHPMAGGTKTGAGAADVGLFRDRLVVLTPCAETDPGALSLVRDLWRGVGARVVEIDAELHDRVVATASHLPQMLVFALAATAERHAQRALIEQIAGAGFDDTTRLASSDHPMWLAIAQLNRESILEAMDAFDTVWSELRDGIATGDDAAMSKVMTEARSLKTRMGRK